LLNGLETVTQGRKATVENEINNEFKRRKMFSAEQKKKEKRKISERRNRYARKINERGEGGWLSCQPAVRNSAPRRKATVGIYIDNALKGANDVQDGEKKKEKKRRRELRK